MNKPSNNQHITVVVLEHYRHHHRRRQLEQRCLESLSFVGTRRAAHSLKSDELISPPDKDS